MATTTPPPAHIEPMLARAGALPRDPERWSFEIKWDGVRAIAHITESGLRIESRNLRDITATYPELSPAPAGLGARSGTVLDGEIVAIDSDGKPSFGLLQQRMNVAAPAEPLRRRVPVSYVVFDLLYLDGEDLTGVAYRERRARLEALGLDAPGWRVPPVHPGQGRELLEATRQRGLEGIVAKRLDSAYRAGARSGGWLKLKHTLDQELVIGGWLPGEGRRTARIGALLMGHFAGDRFVYDGRVGTGFSERTLIDLQTRLAPLVQSASPFDPRPKLPANAVYVRPELVAEIAFTERTRDGLMRAPSFKGLRTDKAARDVHVEPASLPETPGPEASRPEASRPEASRPETPGPEASRPETPGPELGAEAETGGLAELLLLSDKTSCNPPGESGSPTPGQVPQTGPGATHPGATHPGAIRPGAASGPVTYAGRSLNISNHDKVLYPEAGFTKGQVIDYYAAIAPAVLGHLRDRALTLKRYPNGVDGAFFYEKNSPRHRPDWVATHTVGGIDYTLVQEPATLVWLANLADLELHTSLALAVRPQSPTVLAFDLDPGPPAGLLECAEVALLIRGLFAQFGLISCVKTSGNKGLQVYVPLNDPEVTYAQTKALARRVAELLEARLPELVVSAMTRTRRTGRVFVDWGQNDAHKTTVTVYSLRATPLPSVSTPLSWEELADAHAARDPERLRFSPAQVIERVASDGDRFAPVLAACQTLPVLT